MKINNHTTIPDHIITYYLRDLGILHTNYTLNLVYGDCAGRGGCTKSGTLITVILCGDYTLETLAHELKHVEQHVSGLSEYMKLERELTPYKLRWHEVEAREYARAWRGKSIK
jgi:hypothetical protein